MQPPHFPGRVSATPNVAVLGSANQGQPTAGSDLQKSSGPQRRTGSRRSLPRIPEETLVERRGGASEARLCSHAEHAGMGRCHGDGSAAPRPAPLGVAGGPTGRGLPNPTARRRPQRDQDGGRRGGEIGGEGRKLRSLPSHCSLSRSGREEETAPEAAIELPACLA